MKRDFSQLASGYIAALGGKANIDTMINCATRLRVLVKDLDAVQPASAFTDLGAVAITTHHKMVQVIAGLDVPQIIQEMQVQLNGMCRPDQTLDEYGLTYDGERARILYECLGLPENVQLVTTTGSAVIVQVRDLEWVDPFDVMLQLGIGITSVDKHGRQVYVYMSGATSVAKELNRLIKKHN